jgi:subfamily B ATP-binding cassette protein MsbA
MRIIKTYLQPHSLGLGLAGLCAIGSTVATAGFVAFLDPAVELLFNPVGKKAMALPQWLKDNPLIIVPLIIIGFSLARYLFQRVMATTINGIGHRLTGRLQSDLFSSLIRSDLARLSQQHTGHSLSSVLYDAGLLREAATTGIINSLQNALILLGMLGVMFSIDLVMALGLLVTAPIIGIVMQVYLKATKRAAEGAMSETARLTEVIIEALKGIRMIKINNREAPEEVRVEAVIHARQSFIIKGANARAVAAPTTEAFTGILTAGVIGYAGFRATSGAMGLGDFLSFLAALMSAGQALRQLASLQTIMQEGKSAAIRIFANLDTRPTIKDSLKPLPLSMPIEEIRFDQVSFAYDQDQFLKPVIDKVSFSAKSGEIIALVGPSGSGKTTILNLISRFYEASEGAITINNNPINDYSLRSLRDHMALVAQEPLLFNETIADNLRQAVKDASDEALWGALEAADAADFVRTLSRGLDSDIGESGNRLSGGQKQRLSIARAFLKNAPILLLDEATSALDTQSEQRVQTALERLMKGRTTFIVAHRLSTVQNADKILVLNQGRLVESGSHRQLIEAQGLYAHLAKAQSLSGMDQTKAIDIS